MASNPKKNKAYQAADALVATHPDVWNNLSFTLQYGWLTVGDLLTAPAGTKGKFTLEPFDEPDVVGDTITRLRVVFKSKDMILNWANTIFDTVGTQTPVLQEPLPEWVDNQKTQQEYRRILRGLITSLKLDACDLQRIEGRFERVEKFPDEIDVHDYIFRGVYLAKAVESSNGPNTDLVVFIANDPGGGTAPDGGATGPPK